MPLKKSEKVEAVDAPAPKKTAAKQEKPALTPDQAMVVAAMNGMPQA